MAARKPIFTPDAFHFFQDLAKHNRKTWMDENRERYRSAIVQPCRQLFEELCPAVLEIDERFDVSGRNSANFSRINNDIRFSKDKTLYKTQMYVKFPLPSSGDRESGQLYVGLSQDAVTAGFRIYAGSKRRDSALALIAEPRFNAKPKWLGQQKRRLGRRCDSYWYSTERGAWIKHDGWPSALEDWKKIRGWIVRKKMKPAAALRRSFPSDLAKTFREVYPLLSFTSIP